MPEIGMSVSMSGDGKRGVGHRPQATAPILDSTNKVWSEYDRVKLCDVIAQADPVAPAAAAVREIAPAASFAAPSPAAPAAAASRDAAFAPLSAPAAMPKIFVAKDDAGTRDAAARLRQEPRVAESS